jgi:hypothetical protein
MNAVRIEKVFLYTDGVSGDLNVETITGYLAKLLKKVSVVVRPNPVAEDVEKRHLYAREIAAAKIQNPITKHIPSDDLLFGEISFEERRLSGESQAFGVIYDGFILQRIYSRALPAGERKSSLVHIFLTNRLFATWGEGDRRYHARTSVYGYPHIISTTGIVEAPAKPKEYYQLKQQFAAIKGNPLELTHRFKGRFIDYEDEAMTEVVKGYAAQAVSYSLIGDPFCTDKGCRMYNAHWQEELIYAQLNSPYEFCQYHAGILEKLGNQ